LEIAKGSCQALAVMKKISTASTYIEVSSAFLHNNPGSVNLQCYAQAA